MVKPLVEIEEIVSEDDNSEEAANLAAGFTHRVVFDQDQDRYEVSSKFVRMDATTYVQASLHNGIYGKSVYLVRGEDAAKIMKKSLEAGEMPVPKVLGSA